MSTHTASRLNIVEVVQPSARRVSAGTSPNARVSGTKRAQSASEGKSAKKSAGRKSSSRAKIKVRAMARPVKASAAAQSKPVRQQPAQLHPQTEMAIEPVLPIEIDVPSCDAEGVETQVSLAAEEVPVALEPVFSTLAAVDEALMIQNIESNVYPAVESSAETSTALEMEVIAEAQPSLAETMSLIETPMQSVLLAEPQSIRRTFAFQWNAFLQVLAKGWHWLQRRLKTQQSKKRLRVCESVSLGEKRFIAVVQVDGEQFLVGGSSSSVSTLAHLEQPREFAGVFRSYEQSGMQA